MKHFLVVIVCLLYAVTISGEQRWQLNHHNGITWSPDGTAYHDHIEMSGKRMSTVLRYGVESNGNFSINKSMIWPMLRTIPNDTHASLMRRFSWNVLENVAINNRSLDMTKEEVKSITLDGTLTVESNIGSIGVERVYLPSTELPALIEIYKLTNNGKRTITIDIPEEKLTVLTSESMGVNGSYRIEQTTYGFGTLKVEPYQSVEFSASLAAYSKNESSQFINAADELSKRRDFVNFLMSNLILETPDKNINQMFAFSKIRACESIYQTKGGPMHGPGGESYYAAIWANDQAEYINPYFPFTGYDYGRESAVNAFMHFARWMNKEGKPIPSSIIAEGDGYWNGAGDRGDAAMIAYGASRYALASGNKDEAIQLWPLIEWCLDYCKKHLNAEGVVSSDSDELEGRFPSGEANLCTSSLYYDALLSASFLAKDLDKPSATVTSYKKQAMHLKENINKYFGANVEGFDTYAYYKGNDILRAWICIPLTVGIDTKAKGTIDALFSQRLWTENGLLTQAGTETFWDRSTLYALRGVFAVGDMERGMEFFKAYTEKRLLGNHVPYAIEAWPEGNQRHLSAESGLYGRIVTEGIFGIRPTGLRSFSITPHLSKEWDEMSLRHVRICSDDFDITVSRNGGKINVKLSREGKIFFERNVDENKVVDVNLK